MFEDIKAMAAVKKGFKLGVPNWAGTFFLLILAEIFALIIQGIAFTPCSQLYPAIFQFLPAESLFYLKPVDNHPDISF